MYKELHYSISYSVCMCVNVHLYVGAHAPVCVCVCIYGVQMCIQRLMHLCVCICMGCTYVYRVSCTCVCVCMGCTCVWRCMCTCGRQRIAPSIIPQILPTILFLRQDLSHGFWGLNWDPQAHTVNSLSAATSPQHTQNLLHLCFPQEFYKFIFIVVILGAE